MTDEHAAAPDSVFTMDPGPTLRGLARSIVSGQAEVAAIVRSANAMRATSDVADPRVKAVLDDVDTTVEDWYVEALPSLIASLRLALEVYDTFGDGLTTITDAIDAALWNNKYFAWTAELSTRRSPP